MPHIIIEHSEKLTDIPFPLLFDAMHQALAELTDIDSCKSRAICLQHDYIGKGEKNSVIFAVTIKLMPGRDQQQKDKLTASIRRIIKQYIMPLCQQQQLNCQASIELIDLQHYRKLSITS